VKKYSQSWNLLNDPRRYVFIQLKYVLLFLQT